MRPRASEDMGVRGGESEAGALMTPLDADLRRHGERRVLVATDELVDLRFLFGALWRGKYVIMLCALAGLAYGVWRMTSFVPEYVAKMIVMPSDPGDGAAPGGSARQQGGELAAAFGITRPGPKTASTFDRLRVLLSSVTLAERLQAKYGLMQRVFRGSWDPASGRWLRPQGERFESIEGIRAYLNLSTWSEPTLQRLAGYIGSGVVIEEVEDTTFYSLSFAHTDPAFAQEILERVYREADDLLRAQDIERTTRYRDYLQGQLEATSTVEMRVGLVQLLLRQESVAMMLQSDLPYAARIIEPTTVSDQPTAPNPTTYVGRGVLGGGAIAIVLVALVALFRRESR